MEGFEEILKTVIESEHDNEKDLDEIFKQLKVSEKGQAAAKSALRLLAAFKDELPNDLIAKLESLAGFKKQNEKEDEEYKYPEPEKKEKVKKWLDAMPDEIKKAFDLEKLTPVDKGSDMKDVSPELQAILKSQADKVKELETKNEEITKSLKDERDKRELEQWIAKCEKELSHYPGKSFEEMGKILKSLHEVNPELANEQFEQMKKASELIEKSEILKVAGHSFGNNTGSAWAEIEKAAAELIQKAADTELTKAQAITKVIDNNPELYNKYLAENSAQLKG